MADYLDDLLSANKVLGDEKNIFGGGSSAVEAMMKVQNESGTSIIDYKRYASGTENGTKTDYSKLTQIPDHDEYKITVIERDVVITEDGQCAGGSTENGFIARPITETDPDGEEEEEESKETLRSEIATSTEQNEVHHRNAYDATKESVVTTSAVKEQMYTLHVAVADGETLVFNGISPNSSMSSLRTELPKLKHCTFFDRDGYEVPNPNTTLETVAKLNHDQCTFLLKASIVWTHDHNGHHHDHHHHDHQGDSAPDPIIEDSAFDAEEAPLQRQSSGSLREGVPLNEVERKQCCVIL